MSHANHARPTTMQAIVQDRYGPPEILAPSSTAVPTPDDDQVLVRVHAAAVTPSDCAFRQGRPWVTRLFNGLLRPKFIPGSELAGEVEAVGHHVEHLEVGDRVFGDAGPSFGAHAQYVCVPEDHLAPIPTEMTYPQAVALVDGALTSLTFLRDGADLQAGQRLLINGASGSVGAAAVQLAKHTGAHVTGVCSTRNLDLVASLGADTVIDYTKDDFTQGDATYDVIFDAVGTSSYARCRPRLTPGGIYLTTALSAAILLQTLWTAKAGAHTAKILFAGLDQTPGRARLLARLAQAGHLRPVLDRTYPLDEIAHAHHYVDQGHKTGTVAIAI